MFHLSGWKEKSIVWSELFFLFDWLAISKSSRLIVQGSICLKWKKAKVLSTAANHHHDNCIYQLTLLYLKKTLCSSFSLYFSPLKLIKQTFTTKMFDILTYYRDPSYFFAYFAFGLQIISVIFGVMTCMISSNRRF